MRASKPILANEPITARRGMVVAQHPLGARAGLEILAKGGNAVDAAVTTAFAMGVVQPLMNGIGGGGQMIVRLGNGAKGAVDYGMKAPLTASDDMYEVLPEPEALGTGTLRFSSRYNWPQVRDNANLDGHTAIATPGTVAGLSAALARWGTMELKDAIAPAIELAEHGFTIGHHMSLALVTGRDKLLGFPGATSIFYPNGQPIATGERIVQTDHARTLRLIADGGPDAFYRGEPAQRIAEDAQANGARLSKEDFAAYEAVIHEQVIRTSYRDIEVLAVPGPGAAPTLIEILNILSNFDLRLLGHGNQDSLHVIAEAIKMAAVDRFSFLGDCAPDGGPADVLMDPEYAARRAAEISRLAAETEPGDPWAHAGTVKPAGYPKPSGIVPDAGTTHITVVDTWGGAVSLTQTLHGYSGVVTPGVGAMMNNGMGWFYPGTGTVNSVAPGGRGLHNMVPVLLLQDGALRAALGASGGRRIWTAVLQAIVHYIDFEMSLQDAVQLPRIHVETDQILLDGRFGKQTRDALVRLGHNVMTATPRYDSAPFSEPNGICVDGGVYESAVYPVAKPTVALGLDDGDSDEIGADDTDIPESGGGLMP
jgi:gamma-glutamyltranspeptidase/glutathione hydrolase